MNGPLSFRRDITVVEHDDEDGHKTVVLKNPVSGALFRLSEYEFYLIKQFDGSKSIEQVIDALKSEGLSYEEEYAESILTKASSAGLMLSSPASASAHLEQSRQRANQMRRLRSYLSPLSVHPLPPFSHAIRRRLCYTVWPDFRYRLRIIGSTYIDGCRQRRGYDRTISTNEPARSSSAGSTAHPHGIRRHLLCRMRDGGIVPG